MKTPLFAEATMPPSVDPPEVALALESSPPVALSIPSVGLQTDLMTTGLQSDNTLEVPPGHKGAPASWYNGSPTPGSAGPAILLGHVNSTEDAIGVFYELRNLVAGDLVMVTRQDGMVATFEVYQNDVFLKSEFPTKAVYFPVPGAEIRLITCERFIASDRRHDQNRIVYARLIATS